MCFLPFVAIGQPTVSLTPVITGLTTPIQLVNAGDGSNKIYIVQKDGVIKVYSAAYSFLANLVTVTGISNSGEQGLLSMAFDPQFASNGFFYVYYVNTSGNLELARYHISVTPNVADAASKVILITIPHPTNTNHNGGTLQFGADGNLYLSTGDGGGAGDVPNNAQNTTKLLGKILRFAVTNDNTPPYYTIPAGNPFGNEVFVYGLRNPFRWSFDRLTHDMWIGDVGQDSWEEIDYRAAASINGTNFGWHCYEGNVTYNTTGCGAPSSYVFPVYTYPTQNPSAAVTGGVVYRGGIYLDLYGYYIATDFYSGIIYKVVPDGAGGFTTTTQVLSPNVTGVANFGETEDGEIYAVSLTAGTVSHLTASGAVPVILSSFSGTASNNMADLVWHTSSEINVQKFEVEYSTTGTGYTYAGMVAARNIANGTGYTFSVPMNNSNTVFYRLKIFNTDGSYTYSQVIRVVAVSKVRHFVSPSVITDGNIHINLAGERFQSFELISMNGGLVFKKDISGETGSFEIQSGRMVAGVYMVRLVRSGGVVVEKVMVY